MENETPRAERTPSSEAETAISMAYLAFLAFSSAVYGKTEDEILEEFTDFVIAKNDCLADGDVEKKELDELNMAVSDDESFCAMSIFNKTISITVSYAMQAKREKNKDIAWSYVVSALYMASSLRAFDFGERVLGNAASDMARRGAKTKLKNDPKQAEKALVRECWDDWQKKPDSYKGKTAFAKDMLSKYETLENQNVIVRWCGVWEKENSTQLAE